MEGLRDGIHRIYTEHFREKEKGMLDLYCKGSDGLPTPLGHLTQRGEMTNWPPSWVKGGI